MGLQRKEEALSGVIVQGNPTRLHCPAGGKKITGKKTPVFFVFLESFIIYVFIWGPGENALG